MVIPWNALGVVGGAVVFLYDRTKDRRAKAKRDASGVGPAPEFEGGAADVALFTTYEGEVRHFDPDVKAGLLPLLDARGLRHVGASSLAETPEQAAALSQLGSFYLVVPLADGQVSAGETIRTCQESGGVVLGSLSLITLPAGGGHAMLVAIGGPALEKSANAAGEFAVLSQAVATAKTDPAPTDDGIIDEGPDVRLQEVMAAKPDLVEKAEHQNGAAKPESKAVLGNVFELAKEEGTS